MPKSIGLPDGAAVDTDGGYWCALHGGGRLRRYTAQGEVDRDIDLPISKPTMCAFAGKDLDVLYVTSASEKLTPNSAEWNAMRVRCSDFGRGQGASPGRACCVEQLLPREPPMSPTQRELGKA